MKITEQHSEPEHVKDRQPYRIRIDGKRGETIEIVEQMNGGFSISSATSVRPGTRLVVRPVDFLSIVVSVEESK